MEQSMCRVVAAAGTRQNVETRRGGVYNGAERSNRRAYG